MKPLTNYVTTSAPPPEQQRWHFSVVRVDHDGEDETSEVKSFKTVAEKEFEKESDGHAWAKAWTAALIAMPSGKLGVTPTLGVLKALVAEATRPDGSSPDLALMGFGTWTKTVGSLPKDFPMEPADAQKNGISLRMFIVDGTAFMASAWCDEGLVQFVSANAGEIVVRRFGNLDYLDI